ncbi:hypothetical protein GCM10025873_01240 [Demequina sediminis]|nr:hypothetical protein GCM10025873_01240 [Demequina sediminis]
MDSLAEGSGVGSVVPPEEQAASSATEVARAAAMPIFLRMGISFQSGATLRASGEIASLRQVTSDSVTLPG